MVAEIKKSTLECIFPMDAKCLAEMLPSFWAEWYVPLIIFLPLLPLVLRMLLNGLASISWLPLPFVHERVKDFTQPDKAKISHLDADVIERLAQGQQQTLSIMAKADAGLQWLYGNPIFSLASYQRALLIAFVYPLLVMLLVWLVSGVGSLGGFKVLPDLAFLSRLGLVVLLLGGALLLWLAVNYRSVLASKLIEKFGWDSKWQVTMETVIFLVAVVAATVVATVVAAKVPTAIAVIFAGAFADAGAITFAGAIAVIVAGAVPVTLAVAFTFYYAILHLIKQEDTAFPARRLSPLWLALLLYGGLLLTAVYLPPHGSAFYQLLPAKRTQLFVFAVFLTSLPIINAFFDWLSVSFTRWLFGKYTQNNTQTLPWWWIVADLIVTVLLCLGLYHSVILLLSQMQASGWQVDVQQTVRTFNQQPLGGQSSWLTWLAITNFIPLGLHYVMIMWGIYQRRWGVPAHVAAYVSDLQAGKALSSTDARTLAMFLTWDRWMVLIAMLLLIPSVYMLLQWLLHWSLRIWL